MPYPRRSSCVRVWPRRSYSAKMPPPDGGMRTTYSSIVPSARAAVNFRLSLDQPDARLAASSSDSVTRWPNFCSNQSPSRARVPGRSRWASVMPAMSPRFTYHGCDVKQFGVYVRPFRCNTHDRTVRPVPDSGAGLLARRLAGRRRGAVRPALARRQPGRVPQLGEVLVGIARAKQKVADRDAHHRRGGDVGVLARDDPADAFLQHRQQSFRLCQYVSRLDVHHRADRVLMLEVDDELERGVESVGTAQARHRRRDPCVEVVLLVESEGVEQPLLGSEVAVQRGSRHPGLGGDFGQLQIAVPTAREHDERRGEYALASRLLCVGGHRSDHHPFLYIYSP